MEKRERVDIRCFLRTGVTHTEIINIQVEVTGAEFVTVIMSLMRCGYEILTTWKGKQLDLNQNRFEYCLQHYGPNAYERELIMTLVDHELDTYPKELEEIAATLFGENANSLGASFAKIMAARHRLGFAV